MITGKMKVTDVVKTYPEAVEIFNDFHIDYCCGGKAALEDAIRELGIESKSFIELLNKKLVNETHKSNKGQDNLEKEIDLKKIDFIIANHGEVDHSGSLPKLM